MSDIDKVNAFEFQSIQIFDSGAQEFLGGRLSEFITEWQKITSDKKNLQIVQCCQIEFDENPIQLKMPYQQKFDRTQERYINEEVENLLFMNVIREVQHIRGEFISTIFSVPKKDSNEQRVIFNLKELNKSIAYHYFKMETFEAALKLVKPNSMMASLDLRHAYYSSRIHEQDRKFLRFIWDGKVYEYTCLPMGISCAPRKFTKNLKPVFAVLHQMGFQSTSYIDDTLLVGDSKG